ncbi:MAG: MMPL family transporter [Candidatus Nanohaloarchaea archaeon]
MIEKLIDSYSEKLVNHPIKLLIILTVSSILIATGVSNIENVDQNNEDFLPDTVESVEAFDVIGAEFGQGEGGTTYTVMLESSPSYANSNEIRDVRDPELLRYIETISNDIESMDDVATVSSAADLVKDPATKREAIKQLQESGQASQYISEDYSFTILRVSTTDISSDEQDELASRIRTSVERNDKPAGIEAGYTGQPFINQAFQRESQSTQGQTSLLSIIGVFLVVVLLFRSVINGLTSLSALIFGIITGIGIFGWLGFNLSPATSGSISMGMGIAIDFGIQTVSRYKDEREKYEIEKAVSEMIKGVIKPMTIALIAAIIGFTALSFGRITFLSELGTLLTLTTLFAYIGALTLIPILLVLYDQRISKIIPDNIYQKILGEIKQ